MKSSIRWANAPSAALHPSASTSFPWSYSHKEWERDEWGRWRGEKWGRIWLTKRSIYIWALMSGEVRMLSISCSRRRVFTWKGWCFNIYKWCIKIYIISKREILKITCPQFKDGFPSYVGYKFFLKKKLEVD